MERYDLDKLIDRLLNFRYKIQEHKHELENSITETELRCFTAQCRKT